MEERSIKIKDALGDQFPDFLSFCELSNKAYTNELTNVDYVAFRTGSGKSREYIGRIKEEIRKAESESVARWESANHEESKAVSDSFCADVQEGKLTASANTLPPSVEDTAVESASLPIPHEETEQEKTIPNAALPKKDFPAESVATLADSFFVNPYAECFKSLNLSQLELSNHTKKALQSANIETALDLLKLTPEQLSRIKGIGKNAFHKLEEIMEAYILPLSYSTILEVSPSDFKGIRIGMLDLSARSNNALKRAQVFEISDLLKKTRTDLKKERNLGAKSLSEISRQLFVYCKTQSCYSEGTQKSEEKSEISKLSVSETVKSILLEEPFTMEAVPAGSAELLEHVKEFVKTAGKEICLETFLNPERSIPVQEALAETFLQGKYVFYSAMEQGIRYVQLLKEDVRKMTVFPLFWVFAARKGEDLKGIYPFCSKQTTIAQLPYLYPKLSEEENGHQLVKNLNHFLQWMNYDLQKMVNELSSAVYNALTKRGDRLLEIIKMRADGKTLEEVGTYYSLTRERVRQIERKASGIFWNQYYSIPHDLMTITALQNGRSILRREDLQKALGDVAPILWACLKQTPDHDLFVYVSGRDAVFMQAPGETKWSNKKLQVVLDSAISSLPLFFEAEEKDDLLSEQAQQSGVPFTLLKDVVEERYQLSGRFLHRARITTSFICEYVLRERFPAGFKVADTYEAKRFWQYAKEFFGDAVNVSSERALDARISSVGILCDRGRYFHPDYLQVDPKTMSAIWRYIEKSSRSTLPYGEIYEALKETLEGTQITNRFLLQGALKKYGCKYHAGKDCIRKKRSASFLDDLESFVETRGIVHKSEIFAEFLSMSDANLQQLVSHSTIVFNIDNGYYMHASLFDIQPEDYTQLRAYLADACKDIPVNIRSVHDAVAAKFPEFMFRNDFEDRSKLYAALQYMFHSEFSFSRPYIAKRGTEDISNKSVIRRHIEDYDSIEIEELIDICEENSIHYIGLSHLCLSLAPEYVRINRTTLMKRELTGISEDTVEKATEIVKEQLSARDFIVGAKVNDFLWFPEIEVDWNEYLLESIIAQSKKIDMVNLIGDPLSHPNAVYVSEKFKGDTYSSLLIKLLAVEVRKGTFTSKTEMRDWLREEGLIEGKLPHFLETSKYFYVDETGVHCSEGLQ